MEGRICCDGGCAERLGVPAGADWLLQGKDLDRFLHRAVFEGPLDFRATGETRGGGNIL